MRDGEGRPKAPFPLLLLARSDGSRSRSLVAIANSVIGAADRHLGAIVIDEECLGDTAAPRMLGLDNMSLTCGQHLVQNGGAVVLDANMHVFLGSHFDTH